MSKPNININKTEKGITIDISKEDLLKYIVESHEGIFEFDLTHADEIVQDFVEGLSKHMVTEEFFTDVYDNCEIFEKDHVKRVPFKL